MNRSSTFQLNGRFSIALLCVALTACATTQRSSTGVGGETATPPAAATTVKAAAPASSPEPATQAATPAVPPTVSRVSPRADEGGPMEFPSTNNDTTSATPSAEQAGDLQRKLDEQDSEASTMGKEAAQEAAPASPTGAPPAAKPAKAARKEEDAVVFPERRNTVESASQTRSSIPKPVERSVYFNYDEANVLAKYDAMLLANAAYIKEYPGADVEVQGNCDERGSREYNLALGARRAEQVKRALEVGGVEGKRIHTVSFGKEKPAAMGQDEESYSKNRRADIVY
jgi:peptidoglycan-associated lipoprotein